MELVIDLGKEQLIETISAQFLQQIESWIFMPVAIQFSLSRDGQQFTVIGQLPNSISERAAESVIHSFRINGIGQRARFIKIEAKNRKTCPSWHPGAGGKAWIFCDEIVVL